MNQIPNIEETEALSEKIHHLYCAQYEKDHGEPYWTNGDYSKLDERTKEYDRNIARFIHHQLQSIHTSLVAAVEGMKEDGDTPLGTQKLHETELAYNQALDDTLTIINSIFKE